MNDRDSLPSPMPTGHEPMGVVITGIGVVSPLGCSVDEITRRFAAGERAQPDADGCLAIAGVPLEAIPAEKRAHGGRLDRFCRFLLTASYLAVDSAGLQITAELAERVGLSFGTGLGCLLTNEAFNRKVIDAGPAAASPRLFAYTVSSAPAGEVSIALGIKGPNVTAHMGLAAGLGAVAYGFDLIRLGQADVVLAGGGDATGPALAQGLRDMGLLKSAAQAEPWRDAVPGVCPSEGATILVLEREDRARQRSAPIWGRVDGYAAGFEPTLTRSVRDGRGLKTTAVRALASARRPAGDVDLVFTSAHGTPLDEIERAALAETFGADTGPVLLAPKSAFGESFGASGTLALALAAGVLRYRPELAAGLVRDLQGRPLGQAAATKRLRGAAVVMIHALCYSGNVVSLVLARHGGIPCASF